MGMGFKLKRLKAKKKWIKRILQNQLRIITIAIFIKSPGTKGMTFETKKMSTVTNRGNIQQNIPSLVLLDVTSQFSKLKIQIKNHFEVG